MKPEFKKKVLSNGMTILFEKRNVPVVSVGFAVRHGGVHETSEEKGISHFIEHLLFKGTKKRTAKQLADEIEKNGGDLNGFTNEELTAYWCKIPSKHFDLALDVLTDAMKNPLFDEKEIEKERKVIFEEMKMRKDNPRVYVLDKIQSFAYSSPLGENLIGTEETMNSIDRKKIVKKFKEFYVPQNLILAVVGDADFDSIVKFAEKNFIKDFEKSPGLKPNVPKFEKLNKSEIEKRKGIDQANLVLAYHAPLSGDKKSYAHKILLNLMSNGLSSRLFSEIREKRNLAYSIAGACDANKNFSYNLIYVGTTKEKVEEVKKLILKEFEKVAKSISEKELAQAKEQIIGNYLISMEDSQVQMEGLLYSEIRTKAENFYDFEKNISNVTLNDLKEAAKIKEYSFFALVPE